VLKGAENVNVNVEFIVRLVSIAERAIFSHRLAAVPTNLLSAFLQKFNLPYFFKKSLEEMILCC
jgi:hypothetical protein